LEIRRIDTPGTTALYCDTYLIHDFLESLLKLPLLKSYEDHNGYISPREKKRKVEDVLVVVKHTVKTTWRIHQRNGFKFFETANLQVPNGMQYGTLAL